MLLEQIVDLSKRISKRNRDRLVRQGQSDKVPSKELEEIRRKKLGAQNRIKKIEDKIEQVKKDRLKKSNT